MQRSCHLIHIVLFVSLAGCATAGRWTPTVDPKTSRHPENLATDLAECRELALQASGGTAGKTVEGALVGGAIGAAAGAALGALSGDAGSGAATGAAVAGLGGGAAQGLGAEDTYKQAFRRCLIGRGHQVLN